MVKRGELESLDKDEIIDLFVAFAEKIEKKLAGLQKEVDDLREENRTLKLPKNSRNSSRPPSQDIKKLPRQKSLRKPSGKKSGGQPGHTGNTLHQTGEPDQIICHMPEGVCPQCGGRHSEEEPDLHATRQTVDIPPVRAHVTEHRVYGFQCTCGHMRQGKFPAGVTAPVKYGNRLTGFVSYLSTRQYIPFGRIPELLDNLFGIPLSQGTVYNMLERVADSLDPLYQAIKESILQAPVVGSDESGIKVGSKNFWGWIWQTISETFIVICNSRAYRVIEGEFRDGFPHAVLVSDSLGAQLKTPAFLHQLCLAHLLRELNAFIEHSNNGWAVQMKQLFDQAIELKYSLEPEQYPQPNSRRDSIIGEFHKLIVQDVDDKVPKLTAFKKRMVKHQDSVFTFLFHHDVPFDNNASERAVRNLKVKQKVSGGFRAERGAEIFATIRSVIDTWIKRGVNIFDSLLWAIELYQVKKDFLANNSSSN